MLVAIVIYLLLAIGAAVVALVLPSSYSLPNWYLSHLLYVQCAALGTVGGALYCLRGVYLNKCVHKSWDPDWCVWYILRPFTSTISGFIACIFLQAGILTLGATHAPAQAPYGFWALAFIAGYNVDNFLKKLESAAQTLWSISPSRVGRQADNPSFADRDSDSSRRKDGADTPLTYEK